MSDAHRGDVSAVFAQATSATRPVLHRGDASGPARDRAVGRIPRPLFRADGASFADRWHRAERARPRAARDASAERERFAEVVLATSVTVEGDATAHSSRRLRSKHGVRASRIAYGVPVGGELEFIDSGTLSRALSGRRELDATVLDGTSRMSTATIPTALLQDRGGRDSCRTGSTRTDGVLAFKDIHPQAPFHCLVIPKIHLATLNDFGPERGYAGRVSCCWWRSGSLRARAARLPRRDERQPRGRSGHFPRPLARARRPAAEKQPRLTDGVRAWTDSSVAATQTVADPRFRIARKLDLD